MPVYRLPVRISHSALGGQGANIFHARTAGGVGEGGALNQAIGWLEDFYTGVNQLFPSGTTIAFEGIATEVGAEEPTMEEGLDTWTVTGASTPDVLPPATALVVGWRTALASRSGRGRTFLGPVATVMSSVDGTPASATLDLVRAAATALVDASTASEPLGSVSLGVWSPTDGVMRDITGSAVRDQFAVLRSRRD